MLSGGVDQAMARWQGDGMQDDFDEVTIRPARAEDAEAIAQVHVTSWHEAYAGVVPAEYLDEYDLARRTREWTDWLEPGARPGTRVWVAEVASRVVGFADLGPSRDADATGSTLQIYAIYLEPRWWGRGVARELVRTVLAAAPGVPVTLWVLAANDRARHFYRRHGFVTDGAERLDRIGDTDHPVVRYRRG